MLFSQLYAIFWHHLKGAILVPEIATNHHLNNEAEAISVNKIYFSGVFENRHGIGVYG